MTDEEAPDASNLKEQLLVGDWSGGATTGEDGTFIMTGLGESKVHLTVEKEGYSKRFIDDVEPGAGEVAGVECLEQRLLVDDRPPGRVDQHGVRAHLQADDLVHLLVARGQHDHRHLVEMIVPFQPLREFKATHARQIEIEQDEIVVVIRAVAEVESLLAGAGDLDVSALPGEEFTGSIVFVDPEIDARLAALWEETWKQEGKDAERVIPRYVEHIRRQRLTRILRTPPEPPRETQRLVEVVRFAPDGSAHARVDRDRVFTGDHWATRFPGVDVTVDDDLTAAMPVTLDLALEIPPADHPGRRLHQRGEQFHADRRDRQQAAGPAYFQRSGIHLEIADCQLGLHRVRVAPPRQRGSRSGCVKSTPVSTFSWCSNRRHACPAGPRKLAGRLAVRPRTTPRTPTMPISLPP